MGAKLRTLPKNGKEATICIVFIMTGPVENNFAE